MFSPFGEVNIFTDGEMYICDVPKWEVTLQKKKN